MALREYISGRYKLPLFAGVRSATTAPPCSYDPANCIGSSVPGGIGTGDGGFSTPVDGTITKPTITSPAADAPAVTACDDATSSAFGSSNGQTHIASRWFIQVLDPGYVPPLPLFAVETLLAPWTHSEGTSLQAASDLWGQTWVNAISPTAYGVDTFRRWFTYAIGTAGYPTVAAMFEAGSGSTVFQTQYGYITLYTPPSGGTAGIAVGYVYDSGADGSLLTSLPLETIGLQPGKGYRITVRHKGSNGGWSDFSDPVDFQMASCATQATACPSLDLPCADITLPPAPPAPPPFPPPPAPPTPPAPPPPAPDVPAGFGQVQIDWAQSRVVSDGGCQGNTFAEIDAQGGVKAVMGGAEIDIYAQNLSATVPGLLTMTLQADNGGLNIYAGSQTMDLSYSGVQPTATLTIPVSTWGYLWFRVGGPIGRYHLTLTSSLGTKTLTLDILGSRCDDGAGVGAD